MPQDKEPIPQFAARIKKKYPQYKDMDDTLLTQKIVEKYPQYRDMVDWPVAPVKKKDDGIAYSQPSSTVGQSGLKPMELTEDQQKQAIQMYEQEQQRRVVDPLLRVPYRKGGDKKLIEQGEKIVREVRNKRETQAAQVALQEGKDLEDMAAHYRAQLDPSFKEQFESLRSTGQFQPEPFSDIVQGKPGREYKARASDIFGKATRGNNLANFILNPNVQQLAKENPEFNIQLKQEAANLLQNFPEFGEKYLGSVLSNKMEQMGINNGLVNVVSKKELDQVVNKLKEEGELTPQEEKFIIERIRPKMGFGNFWRSISGQTAVKTTGFVENALEGAITGVQDLGKGIAETSGINSARISDKGLLSSDIEREHIKVSVKPVGIWHDITTLGGQAFGQSMAIGGGAKALQGMKLLKSPAGAMALSGGMTAYGRYAPEARQKFPDSKLKQIGYTTLMSGIEAATENIFQDTKVVDGLMKEIKSPIQKTIKEFTQKNIDAAAAKAAVKTTLKSAIEKVPQAAKYFGKAVTENTLEEVAAEIGGQASSGIFEGKPVNEWFDGDQIAETAKQGLLGSIFIGGLAARADLKKNQGISAKQIYLMARDPETWAEKIRESGTDPADANDIKDKLENLDYAANLLKELDANTKMTEKQKAKYVLLSLQSKTNAQTEPTATDEVLRGQQQRNIIETQKEFNTAKEEILTGKDDGTFEGDESDKVNSSEAKLFEEIEKAAPQGYKETLAAAKAENNILGGLEYMQDKAAENPVKFTEEFGEELTNKVLKNTPTEKIQQALDYLIENNTDDPSIPVLDKVLQDREQDIEAKEIENIPERKYTTSVEDSGKLLFIKDDNGKNKIRVEFLSDITDESGKKWKTINIDSFDSGKGWSKYAYKEALKELNKRGYEGIISFDELQASPEKSRAIRKYFKTEKTIDKNAVKFLNDQIDFLNESAAEFNEPIISKGSEATLIRLADREPIIEEDTKAGVPMDVYDSMLSEFSTAMERGAPFSESVTYVIDKAKKEGHNINEEEFFNDAKEKIIGQSPKKKSEQGEKIKDIIDRGKTGEPLTFEGFRVSETDDVNQETGAFFSDSDTVDILTERSKFNEPGYAGRFKGQKKKHNVSLSNPLKIKNKQTFLQEIIDNRDEETATNAKKALDDLKEYGFFGHTEVDKIIAKEAKRRGHDGIINEDESEVVVFGKSGIKTADGKESGQPQVSLKEIKSSGELKLFEIIKDGEKVGGIGLKDNGDHYEVKGAKVHTPGEGIGTEAYKQLIQQSDKPIQSDSNKSTKAATALWKKLEKEGFAYFDEKKKVFVSKDQTQRPATGEGQPPISEPPKGSRIFVQRPATELSHKGLQDVANEFSLPDVETRDRKSDIQLRKDAENKINEWVEKGEYAKKVEGLVKKAEEGEILTDEQRVILEQHLANISQELRELPKNSTEFDAKLAEVKRLKDAGEKTRSEAGAALRIPTFRSRPQDLTDYYVAEMEAAGVDKLTEQQKEKAEKEFDDITAAEKAYQDKIAALQEENARLRAEAEVKKARGKAKGQKKDFKSERRQIVNDIKEKLKKARGETQATFVPYARELFAIAPDVAKLMRSYVEQGITELADIVKNIHDDIKDAIPDITEKDVRDLIAGEYNEKRTQSQMAAQLRDLRDEAKLINKLEALESGEEPKSDKAKIERNRQITDLKKKIKDHDLTKLSAAKKRIQDQIEKIEDQLKKGDFAKEEKKPELKLDKEARELQDELIKLKQERERRLLLQEQAKASRWDKIKKTAVNVLGVPRSLMSSIDFSAPLRQSFVATVSNPGLAVKAAGQMFKSAFSQKNYDRWFDDLSKSDRYQLMLDSKLGITNMRDPKLTAREEEYMSNLAQKIPVVGSLVKGSERAYSMYLNKMRVDVFNRLADQMQENGKTWENSKEQYQQLAKFVNNITGRGDLSETLDKASPLLNTLFFSPRLMASRVNTMTYLAQPRFYKTVPAEARKAYFKGLVSTAAVGLLVLGLAKAAGAETEDDPRSPDFGKIKSGNTRWDIWGGHQQYIRLVSQLITGQRKSSTSGRITNIGDPKNPYSGTKGGLVMGFLRGKASPVAGMVTDIVTGENVIGQKLGDEISWEKYFLEHVLPLNVTGIKEAVEDQGAKALFTVGVPSTFGVGVQTY